MLLSSPEPTRHYALVDEVERIHPWLFNLGVGTLLGIVAWYFLRRPALVLVVSLLWVYLRVAWLRSRET
jgi:hypothetical protein